MPSHSVQFVKCLAGDALAKYSRSILLVSITRNGWSLNSAESPLQMARPWKTIVQEFSERISGTGLGFSIGTSVVGDATATVPVRVGLNVGYTTLGEFVRKLEDLHNGCLVKRIENDGPVAGISENGPAEVQRQAEQAERSNGAEYKEGGVLAGIQRALSNLAVVALVAVGVYAVVRGGGAKSL